MSSATFSFSTNSCSTADDTSSDTVWVGIVQDDRILALVQPEVSHLSSSSQCRPSFASRAGILCNPSLRGLLTYKFYRKGLMGCLQLLASIDTPHPDVL